MKFGMLIYQKFRGQFAHGLSADILSTEKIGRVKGPVPVTQMLDRPTINTDNTPVVCKHTVGLSI